MPMRKAQGNTLIEILVAIVIVVVGLLGLAGLQSRATLAEMEAYQRAQAIVLVQDMADRIASNRKNAMAFVTASPLGADVGYQTCTTTPGPAQDQCEWSNELVGAGESASGTKVGAMIGARGCVVNTVATMPRQFTVAVVWQGLNPTAVAASTNCGAGLYGDERTRRAVTLNVTIGCLQNDPVTLTCVTP
jgi:type IV pilus assembly protein PilV